MLPIYSPIYAEEVQTFSVDLYDLQIGKLDQPVDLEKFIETMGTDGQKMSTIDEREAEQPMQKIIPRWLNNIFVMTCIAMTTILMIIILVLLAKHFKMKALVSMLAIQTIPLPVEAVNLTAAMMSAMIAPDPAIGTKVVCAYPVAVIWQNILGYLVLAYAITQFFRPVTWCKGYKYNKKCALYIFVYDENHERYSPLKIMSLKGQMHNYRMKYTGEGISLTLVRSWTYDTMTISLGGVQVMDKSVKMGTKSLGKGKKSNTVAIQSNCSSMHPLNPIEENGEESDMEEQVPELVDLSDNEISSTRDKQQGTTIETTTETKNDNENGNSKHIHTFVLMRNVKICKSNNLDTF